MSTIHPRTAEHCVPHISKNLRFGGTPFRGSSGATRPLHSTGTRAEWVISVAEAEHGPTVSGRGIGDNLRYRAIRGDISPIHHDEVAG